MGVCWAEEKVCFLLINNIIKHLTSHVYLFLMDKNRGNNNRSWVKSISKKLDKSRHGKLTFTIFICRGMDWMITVQLTEQQKPIKEKRQRPEHGRK